MPQEIKVMYEGEQLTTVPNGRTLSLDCTAQTMQAPILIVNDTYAQLEVTSTTGSTVYITRGTNRIDATESSGKWTFKITELGTWAINVIDYFGVQVSENITISEYSVYTKTVRAGASWATGTDAQILTMVEADRRGEIDLRDYWQAGDTRSVSLSAIPSSGTGYAVGESQEAQTVELVLMDTTCQGFTWAETPISGDIVPHFIVGQKDCLKANGYIARYGSRGVGWSGCDRRGWCNNGYYNALPSTIKGIFKQFKWKQGKSDGTGSGLLETTDYFGLAPEKSVFGSKTYSQSDEAALYSQWEWYITAANRKKKGQEPNNSWWECSPSYENNYDFCFVGESHAERMVCSQTVGISPFGCI